MRFTEQEKKDLFQRHGGRCAYCFVEVGFGVVDRGLFRETLILLPRNRYILRRMSEATIDHVNPSRGDGLNNLVLCCRSCNSSKNNKNVFDWLDVGIIEPMLARKSTVTK